MMLKPCTQIKNACAEFQISDLQYCSPPQTIIIVMYLVRNLIHNCEYHVTSFDIALLRYLRCNKTITIPLES
jgi:hypothetical protein